MKSIGRGTPVGIPSVVRGGFAYVKDAHDVLALLERGSVGKVVLVDDAGVSFLAPIHADLAAVLCRKGGIDSHISIVSRSLGIPVLVQVELEQEPADGAEVEVDGAEGLIGCLG
jgi:phosphohistidine swiveling domain-containing protein